MSFKIGFSVFGIFDSCSRYLSVFLGAQLTRLPNGAPVDLLGRLETRLIDADGYEVNGRKSGACLGSRPLVSASRVLRSRAADILVMSVYRMPCRCRVHHGMLFISTLIILGRFLIVMG